MACALAETLIPYKTAQMPHPAKPSLPVGLLRAQASEANLPLFPMVLSWGDSELCIVSHTDMTVPSYSGSLNKLFHLRAQFLHSEM